MNSVSLTVVEDGAGYVVGDPSRGVFVKLPAVGVLAIEKLRAGSSVAQVAADLRTHATSSGSADQDAAEDGGVDVLDFAETLVRLGFVRAVDGVPTDTGQPRVRWRAGPPPRRVRWLFGRTAWLLYGAACCLCVVLELGWSRYRPHADDVFVGPDPLVSFALVTVLSLMLSAGHEVFHWLAACAEGVAARFSVSRRWYFLVFETDLTQLWGVPRARRYGPLLAGLAFDSVVLAGALLGRTALPGGPAAPSRAGQILAVLSTVVTAKMLWQLCVFLRNDLYLVLSAGLGCTNLWRVSMLTLKRYAAVIRVAERAELAAADPKSRAHARWYCWLCVAGTVPAAWFAVAVLWPIVHVVVAALAEQLSSRPMASGEFWEALAFGVLALLPFLLLLSVLLREWATSARRLLRSRYGCGRRRFSVVSAVPTNLQADRPSPSADVIRRASTAGGSRRPTAAPAGPYTLKAKR